MNRKRIASIVLVLSLGGYALSPASSGGQTTRAAAPAPSGKLQFLNVHDPVYGVDEGKLAFFAGWQGTVAVERNDAACPGCSNIGLKMVSPDKRSQVQAFSDGLHTGVIPRPGGQGHYVRTRFTSTGELITRYILPGLNLDGQPSAPRPALGKQVAAFMEQIKGSPAGNAPFAQAAAVTVSGGSSGKDYVVKAFTIGGSLGTQNELTSTHFSVIEAPAGQAEGVANALDALPPFAVNPEWQRLDNEHQQQQNAQSQQFIRDYNSRQAAFNASQSASNAAARQTQQNRANQSLIDSQQNQRNITDTGNLVNDSRNGNSRYYTFCNSQTGQVVYQYNTTAPPDASGHWLRCGD